MPSYDVNDPNSKNGGQKSPKEKAKPPLQKSVSIDETTNPILPSSNSRTGKAPLESSMSTTSMRRRKYSRRASSSFDFPHLDSVKSVPSIQLEEIDLNAVPWWTSHRFRLAILSFFGFVILYAQRVNLSIAIVSMVNHSALKYNSSSSSNSSNLTFSDNFTQYSFDNLTKPEEPKCPELKSSLADGEFLWSKEDEGLLLGAFFWGYLVFQVIGGRLSERFGAKKVIAIAMFPVAILTILSPVAARASRYLFLVVRVIIGLGEVSEYLLLLKHQFCFHKIFTLFFKKCNKTINGVMYPAAQAFWASWAPPNERSRLIGFSYAGGQFGNALIFPIAGYLCAYGFDGGWPSVFYVIGSAGFIWCVFWVWLVSDTPDQDKTISDIEKKFIKYSIGQRSKGKTINKEIPWKAIFTSRPVWAILVAHMCGNYGAYMLLTKLPAYMKEVLKFDIKSNGVFSMLPYLLFWFIIILSGMIADLLISREILSVGNTRKLMSAIGMVGPSAFLIATGFMECDQQVAAVILLTLAIGLCGVHFSGFFINHGDIAPPYAGTLFGISNTLATVPGILSPYIVSAMTKDGTREQWLSTFYVAAGIYCFGALWYCILGKGEIQKWAGGEDDDEEEGDVGFGLHEIQETVHEEDEEEEEDVKKKGLLAEKDSDKVV
ncbi:unnamed protein product [Lymnaea stagnalis]|uniref:Major facilitator superfamily (MFS) profile domain-containing protein n=1 Tax=Lymnaea stagnalis TaxID=6523 RepID=A0AAV2HBM8_LYMST